MKNNYLVIDNPSVNNNLCIIFFSSNSVRSNTLSQEEDHNYEFYNISRAKRIRELVNRIIFLRDISNNFYINGINKDINNIEKIIGLLRTLTNGFECYCCGYSAGGYMSLICKYYLPNIKRVYNFGGIVNVLDWHGAYSNYNYYDREVVAHASELQKSYFDISDKLKEIISRDGVYSFYAANAQCDINIVEAIRQICGDIKYNLINFNTDKHGYYCWSYDYKYLFSKSDNELNRLFNALKSKIVGVNEFSVKLQGPIIFVLNKVHNVFRRVINMMKKLSIKRRAK